MAQSELNGAVRPHLSRRGVIVGGAAAIAVGGIFAARWFNIGADVTGTALGVADAHRLANAGGIFLIDIRRPDEWARTGIGEGAHPIDMRRADFIDALRAVRASGPDLPVALICARGVRSRRLTEQLTAAGLTNIVDVPEGMLGSGAGPGWLRSGLPVVPAT